MDKVDLKNKEEEESVSKTNDSQNDLHNVKKGQLTLVSEENEYNVEDGMTNSILSDEEDKPDFLLDKFKIQNYIDKDAARRRLSSSKLDQQMEVADQQQLEESCVRDKELVMEMIENLDSAYERVKEVKLTKIDFIDCLRGVTQKKVFAVKEARDIFEKRIRKLIRSQEYELSQQENICILTAQEVFLKQA